MQYAIVIERSATGFGVYVPDLPGCAVVGDTEAEVRSLIREAIELHLEALRENASPSRRRPRASTTWTSPTRPETISHRDTEVTEGLRSP